MLLQVVLCAYAHGIVSRRAIARCVSTLGTDVARLFAGVLAVCGQRGLIGREMCPIDGVKLAAVEPDLRSPQDEITAISSRFGRRTCFC